MTRLIIFLPVFVLMVALVGGAHYYVWSRLVRDPALPELLARVLTYGLIFLFLAIPGTLFLRRSSFRPINTL